jgi:hypothetical protein
MRLKSDYLLIKAEVERRGITSLVHFTPTINLMGIIEQKGLKSRESLENLDIEVFDLLDYVKFTDDIRYDDKSYINLSITRPNQNLLKAFMERTKDDPTIDWCVLTVSTDVLLWEETLFSVTNAASIAAKLHGIGGTVEHFYKMFADELSLKYLKKRSNGQPSNQPTDIQAEVLVRNEIPLSLIHKISFRNQASLSSTKAALSFLDHSALIFDVNESVFL